MTEPDEPLEDFARDFVETAAKLIEIAVVESIGPVQALSMLRVATRAIELTLSPEIVEKAAAVYAELSRNIPDEELRYAAEQKLSYAAFLYRRGPIAIDENTQERLAGQAVKLIESSGTPFYALVFLHLATNLAARAMKARPGYSEEQAADLAALRRFIDGIRMEVDFLPTIQSKGGDA